MKNAICIAALLFSLSINLFGQKYISLDLSEEDKKTLNAEIEQILEDDQKYRNPIALGTTKDSLIQDIKRKSDTMDIQSYIKYTKSLNLSLSKEMKDSLWTLQHGLDFLNYQKFKKIVEKYGYPSKDRIRSDKNIFVILLHPPHVLDPQEYLNEMKELLLPEVYAGRMPPKNYALLYDNIKGKILKEPQLYGTNGRFDMKTMKVLPPAIVNIEKTNAARLKIGLEALEEGAYELVETD